jgi:putative tricarboxylic transport membrane protein
MNPDQREQPGPGRSLLGLRLVAAGLLAFSLIALYQVFKIRQGAGYSVVGTTFFPFVVVIGLLVLSAILLLRVTVFRDQELAERAAAEETMTHWLTIGLTALALAVYAFALRRLGYVVATTLFFPGIAQVLGSRQPLRNFAIGLLLSVVIYVTFTSFLGIRLPAGLLAGLL